MYNFSNNYQTIDNGSSGKKCTLVYFYKPNCPFCNSFNKDGVWEKLLASKEIKYECVLIKIELGDASDIDINELKKGLSFTTVPNFAYYSHDGQFIENYKGARTFSSMSKYLLDCAHKKIYKKSGKKKRGSQIRMSETCSTDLPLFYLPCLNIKY